MLLLLRRLVEHVKCVTSDCESLCCSKTMAWQLIANNYKQALSFRFDGLLWAKLCFIDIRVRWEESWLSVSRKQINTLYWQHVCHNTNGFHRRSTRRPDLRTPLTPGFYYTRRLTKNSVLPKNSRPQYVLCFPKVIIRIYFLPPSVGRLEGSRWCMSHRVLFICQTIPDVGLSFIYWQIKPSK